ncbi:monooxygenase flavin-binding family protein [Frondihabitans sucicola]|uniref:Monooxygenase flavin-binding family protein n=1 Tax=Frondihabitans sucicola TaxID=1268041 RepID=A0ABN6Y8C1_9MICO|nr:NAD(P)/FAD-dependent oxidoreductase [Frondihabitans sucicola]BDZ52216.1 monooxygenase flavin-binding family protein [Frondihabitans sucicola]
MQNPTDSDYVDVLIVGAGISGIGAGYRLQTELPHKTYAILEARERSGGTWDLFRYPGVRSDSDAFTLSYPFRPWRAEASMAQGDEILSYIRDTAEEFGIDDRIRFGHRVLGASWSSTDSVWRVRVATADGERVLESAFLYVCSGYYDYDAPYDPELPGVGDFAGSVVHPQHWPDDLDLSGRKVVVVGSGATAMSLIPALADRAGAVTLLQRTPSYVFSQPQFDGLADALRDHLPAQAAHTAVRWKNALLQIVLFQLCRRVPWAARLLFRHGAKANLPASVDPATHFAPPYQPWDQRVCIVPDNDLFHVLADQRAEIVTDTIERFVPEGIRLSSGRTLEADLVVTATGLQILTAGGIRIDVDGESVDLGERWFYKGLLVSGVPNFALCIGYTNASWNLRSDLSTRYLCRLLAHLDRSGFTTCVPAAPPDGVEPLPLIDLKAGYVTRSAHLLPHRAARDPWRMKQNYLRDFVSLRVSRLDDRMAFGRVPVRPGRRAAESVTAGEQAPKRATEEKVSAAAR